MESFIVRVYRRAVGPRGEPAGTVERVGGGERVAFTNRSELLVRLFRSRKPARPAPHAPVDVREGSDTDDE